MPGKIDDPECTYIHDETFVRSELPDILKACAKDRMSVAFMPADGDVRNAWTVRVPANQRQRLLVALRAAGV